MSNKIQIKRSVANSTVTGLSNGELAFTQASNTLWIGLPDGSGTASIGGVRNPGVLTANQALVSNSSSGIDKIIVANAAITSIWANSTSGSNGQVLVSNGTGVYWGTGTSGANTQIQFNDSGVANAVAGFTFNKTSNTLFVGNTVLTTNINAASVAVGTQFVANTTQVSLAEGMKLSANGSLGTANQVLRTDTSGVAYWSTDTGDISSVTAGSGLTGGGSSGDVTIDIGQGNGISVSSDAIAVIAGTGVTVNTSGVYIGQAVETTSNVTFANVVTTGLSVVGTISSNVIPSANVTYHLGNTTNRWEQVHTNILHANSGTFDGSVQIGGDLVVTGNVTTVNVASIVVSDPLIYLAGNNYSSDLLDIGFAANYNDGVDRHTGFFRDHVDKVYKIFDNLTQEISGNNDIDTSDPTYRTATLQAYLNSGGLTTNATGVTLTANSTVSVSIIANTLTLSTALAGTSGGTGKATIANNALLVGNSTNGYNELTLGTSGYVLQSNGTAIVYDTLDGGSF